MCAYCNGGGNDTLNLYDMPNRRKPQALASVLCRINSGLNNIYKLIGGGSIVCRHNNELNRTANRQLFVEGCLINACKPRLGIFVCYGVDDTLVPSFNRCGRDKPGGWCVCVPDGMHLYSRHTVNAQHLCLVVGLVAAKGLALYGIKDPLSKYLRVLLVIAGDKQLNQLCGGKSGNVLNGNKIPGAIVCC